MNEVFIPIDTGQSDHRMEAALREAEERYRILFNQCPDGVVLLDPDSARIVEFNDAAARQLGYTRDEYGSLRLSDIDANDTPDLVRERMRQIVTGGRAEFETRHRTKSGGLRTIKIVAQSIQLGPRLLLHCVLQDKTERAEHDRRLATFSKLGEKLGAAGSAIEAGKTIVEAADELLGWDACSLSLYSAADKTLEYVLALDTVEGRRIIVPPAYAGIPSPLVARVIREGGLLILKKDATEMVSEGVPFGDTARPSASILFVPMRCRGQVLGVLSVQSYTPGAYTPRSLDLLQALGDYCAGALERIRAQTAEREALAMLRESQEVAQLGSWTSGLLPDRRLVWSSEVYRIFGITEAEFGGTVHDFYSYVHADDREQLREAKRSALELGSPFDLDHRIVRPDGEVRWVHEKAQVVRDSQGTPVRLVGIIQDISERKKAEEALRKSEEKWKIIFEFAPDACYLHDLQGTMVYANQVAGRLIGCERHELIGKNLLEMGILDGEGVERAKAKLALIAQGNASGPNEYRIHRKDSQNIVLEIRAYPVEIDHETLVLGIARDVTERKRAEAELKASEERYRHVFESVNDAAFVRPINADGSVARFIDVNTVACKRLGYSREELLQKSPLDIDPGVQVGDLRERIARLMAGEGIIFETVHVAKDGRQIPVEISSHCVEWDGRPMMLSVARDLTERKLAEAGLRDSERRLRELLENVRLIAVMLDAEGRILFANRALLSLVGGEAEQTIGKEWFSSFVPADQREEVKQAFSALMGGEAVPCYENEILCRNGERRLIAWNNTHLRDPAGKVVGLSSIGEDITERKKLEQELILREQRLESFFTNSPFGLGIVDEEFHFEQVNASLARINGVPASEHVGRTIGEVLPQLAPVLEPLVRQVLTTGQPLLDVKVSGEVPGSRGETLHALGSYFPLPVQSGQKKRIGAVVVNVTEYHRAEALLRDSEERFRQMAENINAVFWIGEKETGRLIYASPAFEQIWGRTRESFQQQPGSFVQTIHPEDRRRMSNRREQLLSGEECQDEYRIQRPDGSVRWIRDRAFPVRNARGEVYRFAGLAEDITEHRRLEEQFRQAQKMEAVGQLAGGVAHDFNNILAATLMHLGLLQQRPQLPQDILEVLQEMENEVSRAANLTRQLLLFSRRQVAKFEPVDLNAVITELLKMLRRLLGENIEIDFCPSETAVWTKADRGMIDQVVMNLCVNARDAMPKGGRLTLETTLIKREPALTGSDRGPAPTHFVCLLVRDTGCGIPGSILPHIFEPFFTTKGVGKGTGLGLATVYGIVKQHEGWVEVESKPDEGSSFRVYLPALLNRPASGPVSRSRESVRGGSETILLVEDDVALRRTTALCLRKLGYGVLEAADESEVSTIWERQQAKIALLLTDMVMPGSVSGLELALRLKQQKPELKVILSSGYSGEMLEPHSADWQKFPFLPKPYPAVLLARLVRRTLDGEQVGHVQGPTPPWRSAFSS